MRKLMKNKAGKMGISIGQIFGVFMTVLIGATFYSPIVTAIVGANATGTDAVVLGLVTLLYALLMVTVVAIEIAVAFNKLG